MTEFRIHYTSCKIYSYSNTKNNRLVFVIDFVQITLEITVEKKNKIHNLCLEILQKEKNILHTLASVIVLFCFFWLLASLRPLL